MPGFLHLSDAPPRIVIECPVCTRHGEYNRDRAIAKHGNVTLPEFLSLIRSCPRYAAINMSECKAGYSDETMKGLWG